MVEKEIAVYQKKIVPIVEEAKGLKISGAEDMARADEVLSKLNKVVDSIEAEKAKVIDPLNQALKAEKARWKPIETLYGEGLKVVRDEMSRYQTAEVMRQRAEEAKIAARIGEGKGKLKIETAGRQMAEIEVVDKKVGSTSFIEVKVLKIVDIKMIPREYLIVDEKAVLDDLKSGKVVPGAVIELKMSPRNYR
jgi:hypothetical protein